MTRAVLLVPPQVITGVAIYEMSKGSDRAPGDFSFDPIGLARGEKSRFQRWASSAHLYSRVC